MDMTETENFKIDTSGLRGEWRSREPMSKHTSWRCGGEAERAYLPADLADLGEFMRGLPEGEPLYVVGLGSNLLVRDGGMRGTVLLLHAKLNDLHLLEQTAVLGVLQVGAGVACAKVARYAARHGLVGAEFLAGIPGTLGGALAMNAGCYGGETWGLVKTVTVMRRNGELFKRTPHDYRIGYRHVELKNELKKMREKMLDDELFCSAELDLNKGDAGHSIEASLREIKALLQKRINSQPLNLPNAGSVFRNPPGDHAARLIEACGLKGATIGGASVSVKHANFIVNHGNARAADIEALIALVKKTVLDKTGVVLVQEVRIIGEMK